MSVGREGGGAGRFFFLFLFSPVQQTTSEIGHSVKQYGSSFFRVGNQCAECERQQFFLKQQQQRLYGHTYSKSMDQPGKVASPARGQLNRKNEYFPVRVLA